MLFQLHFSRPQHIQLLLQAGREGVLDFDSATEAGCLSFICCSIFLSVLSIPAVSFFGVIADKLLSDSKVLW